jgi:hypothetical protein
MSFLDILKKPKIAVVFIIALALVSIGLGVWATSVYGAGVSGDSIFYLSAAENLLAGRGFVDNSNDPFVSFPPLLVLIFAGLARFFNVDVFVAAWYFNLFLLGINTALGSWWLYRFFREQPIYFLLGSLFMVLSVSNLRMHTAVLSDPLYLTFTLLFFFFGWQYLEKPSAAPFFGMLVLSILAPLLRFSGLAQGVTAGLILLYAHRKQWKTALLLGGTLGALSILPLGLWIYLHNYLLHSTIWGSVSGGIDFGENLLQGLRKILYWFVPYRPISPDGLLEPLILLALIILILLAFNRKKDWVNWLSFFTNPALGVMMIFAAVYFLSTTANIVSLHHRDILSDRYYVIIMLPVLVLLFSVLDRLVLPHLRFSPRYFWLGLLVIFALWSVYPIARIDKYIRSSHAGEWHNYNIFNNREYKQAEIIQQAQQLAQQNPNAVIYSNVPRATWFYIRRPIERLPLIRREWSEAEIAAAYAGWPETPGYLVWLNRDPYERFEDADVLMPYVNMELLARTNDGRIYYISPIK